MPEFIIGDIQYGGYVSVIKLIVMIVLFFPVFPLLGWIFSDSESLNERTTFWTGIILGTSVVAMLLWLIIPIYLIGMTLYIIAVGATSFAYIKNRDSKVVPQEKILTVSSIKKMLSSSKSPAAISKEKAEISFITANKNDVPIPEAKTLEFYGYKALLDLFKDAEEKRASNIIFLPTQNEYNVVYEIDGIATKQQPVNKENMELMIKFTKNLADLEVEQKRKPQKGLFTVRKDKDKSEWEVLTAGSTAGEQLQIRQKLQQNLRKIDELGFSNDQLKTIETIQRVKQGVFIVSGPKKCGVTSTIYALLRNHDAFINNINTLELEIDATLPNITQETFSLSDTGTTTYSKKLEGIIRMGPDIVGVTNCKDTDTAKIICKAASDNKLIYVTIEEDSILKALSKWIKLTGDMNSAIKPLLAISNQRLIRKLCDECKQAYTPEKEMLRKFNIPADKVKAFYRAGKVIYDKHGKPVTCENCQGSGFLGRIAVFEFIALDNNLKKSLKGAKSIQEIGKQFRNARMLYMQEQMLKQVMNGLISVNEMVRVLSKTKKENSKQK